VLKKNRFLLIVCLLGFILRIAYIFAFATYIEPPDWEYGEIARNLVAGKGFARIAYPSEMLELTSSHAPLYPHFLSFIYSSFLKPWSFLVVQFIQTTISVFLIIIAFRTARLLFNVTAAYYTALGVAVYPPIVYYSASMTPTVFSLFFLSLTVFLLLDSHHRTWTRSIIMGLSYGCALLCDPIAFCLIPASAFWLICARKRISKYVFLALVFAILLIIPWSIRNLRVHKSLVPITTQFGVNLWIGNNPRATGTDYYRVAKGDPDHSTLMTYTLSRTEKKELNAMTEIQRAQYFTKKALAYTFQKPFAFCWRLIKKTFFYWWFSPSSINGSSTALRYRIIYGIFYLPLLIFALLRFAIFKLEHQPIDLNLIFALIIMISGVYIITHVGLARYRIPIEYYLLLIAGSAKSRLLKVLKA